MINKTFPVIYQDEIYKVNPSFMASSSLKFKELIEGNENDLSNFQLKVSCEQFTKRDMCNFLKICHNQQTDVQNSELDQICLIAKMFQAEKIFETGINFIRTNIDSNYNIPETFEDKEYLILENTKETIQNNQSNLNENSIQNNQSNLNENSIQLDQSNLNENNDDPILIHHANLNELEFDDSCQRFETEAKDNNNQAQKTKLHSVYYQIKSDNHLLKCERFYLYKNDEVIYMAKIKGDMIYIGPGNDFHISENRIENTARVKRDINNYNIVNTDDQEFKIRYVRACERYSLNVSFSNNNSKLNWRPKEAKKPTSFNGEFNHQPIQSSKNIILQNQKNHPTFILRKMSKKVYEVECHPAIKPIPLFAIALSQIIGPIII